VAEPVTAANRLEAAAAKRLSCMLTYCVLRMTVVMVNILVHRRSGTHR
jgi:hypothetical protein